MPLQPPASAAAPPVLRLLIPGAAGHRALSDWVTTRAAGGAPTPPTRPHPLIPYFLFTRRRGVQVFKPQCSRVLRLRHQLLSVRRHHARPGRRPRRRTRGATSAQRRVAGGFFFSCSTSCCRLLLPATALMPQGGRLEVPTRTALSVSTPCVYHTAPLAGWNPALPTYPPLTLLPLQPPPTLGSRWHKRRCRVPRPPSFCCLCACVSSFVASSITP